MILALLVAQASAIEAEHAFARMAQAKGQWTAFRAFAAPDAVMFAPQPVRASAFLKGRRDPPASVAWSPAVSYVSCDGRWAVNTGSWTRPDRSVGYFSTVWRKRSDGRWRWLLDSGDTLAAPRIVPAHPFVRHAACGGAGRGNGFGAAPNGGYGASGDATLRWQWRIAADGARTLSVELWNGAAYDRVIDDRVAAPAA